MLRNLLVAAFASFMLAACSSGGTGKYHDNNEHVAQFEQSVGDRVYFDYDSSMLGAEAKDQLEKMADWLKEHDRFDITVEGHCDARGTREYNLALGERRAEMVKKHLVKMGIPADKIQTVSYGKERPAVIGDNESAWGKNRRGVVVVY